MRRIFTKFNYLMALAVLLFMTVFGAQTFAASHFRNYFHVSGNTGVNGVVYTGSSVFAAAWHDDSDRVTWYIYKDGTLVKQGVQNAVSNGGGATVRTDDYVPTSSGELLFKWKCDRDSSYGEYRVNVVAQGNNTSSRLSYITVTPTSMQIDSLNSAGQSISTIAHYYDGSTKDVSNNYGYGINRLTLTSDKPLVADVSGNTVYSKNQAGNAIITVRYEENGYSDTRYVNVQVSNVNNERVNSITITPSIVNFEGLSKNQGSILNYIKIYGDFAIMGKNVNAVNLSRMTFTPADPSILEIKQDGSVYTKDKTGSTLVTLRYEYNNVVYGYFNVNVTSGFENVRVRSLTINPSTLKLNETNKSYGNILDYITITGNFDVLGNNVKATNLSRMNFVSSRPDIVEIIDGKLYTRGNAGTATIVLNYTYNNTITTTFNIVVDGLVYNPPTNPSSIKYIKAYPSFKVTNELGRNFGAVDIRAYYYEGGYSKVANFATYTSTNRNIADVQNGLLYTGNSYGKATITVSYAGKIARIYVTVKPKVTGITINPSYANISGTNTTWGEVVVLANYSDGSSKDVTDDVSFSTNNNKVALIDGGYLVSGSDTGNATITASYMNYKATMNVRVDE